MYHWYSFIFKLDNLHIQPARKNANSLDKFDTKSSILCQVAAETWVFFVETLPFFDIA